MTIYPAAPQELVRGVSAVENIRKDVQVSCVLMPTPRGGIPTTERNPLGLQRHITRDAYCLRSCEAETQEALFVSYVEAPANFAFSD